MKTTSIITREEAANYYRLLDDFERNVKELTDRNIYQQLDYYRTFIEQTEHIISLEKMVDGAVYGGPMLNDSLECLEHFHNHLLRLCEDIEDFDRVSAKFRDDWDYFSHVLQHLIECLSDVTHHSNSNNNEQNKQ